MAFQDLDTTQPDQEDGDPLSSAYVQQNADNHNWFHSEKPTCRVYNTGNQSISNNTLTALTFNAERWDVGPMHDTGTNPTRITAPVDGIYDVRAHVQFASNATGRRYVLLRRNGSAVIAQWENDPAASTATRAHIDTLARLAANDYLEVVVLQSSGGALNVENTGEASPEFMAMWKHEYV